MRRTDLGADQVGKFAPAKRQRRLIQNGPEHCIGKGTCPAGDFCEAFEPRERFVAAKEFVAALPGKSDFESRFGGQFRNPIGVQAIDAGLVERPDCVIEIGGHAGGVERDDLMRDVERLGCLTAEFGFIEFGLAEAYRHRGKILRASFPCCRGQTCGIGAAAQKHQDRNIRDQMVPHGVEQHAGKAFRKLVWSGRGEGVRVQRPVGLGAPFAILPDSNVARFQRSHSTDGRPRRWNVAQLKKRTQTRGVELPGHESGG